MSAKVTIRETDGTEYQLKKRIATMVLAAGYSRKVQRGLHEMIRVSLAYALQVVTCDGDGKLNPEGPPACVLAVYPAPDCRTSPALFGSGQNWEQFPVYRRALSA